jgi:hypothetical protein
VRLRNPLPSETPRLVTSLHTRNDNCYDEFDPIQRCLYALTHEKELIRSFMPTLSKLAMGPVTTTLLPVQLELLYHQCEKTGSMETRGTYSKKVHTIPGRGMMLLISLLNAAGTVRHPVGTLAKLRVIQLTKLGSLQTMTRATWAAAGV